MDISEIIKDALVYPTENIKALIIYLLLGLIVGIVSVFTGLGGIVAMSSQELRAGLVVGIIGIIVIIALYLLILGFSLDIIKYGIKRSSDAPEIDFVRQVSDGLKYIIVSVVYMIIPIIIAAILSMVIDQGIAILIGIILMIIVAFILTMAICRLAQTDSLGYALDFKGAIDDLTQIGVGKVVGTIIGSGIVGIVIVMLISFVLALILSIFNSSTLTSTVVPIVSSILDAWLVFYVNRATGLLYSTKQLQ
ncbi:MAG: hypothetical protein BZ135_07070 [Methanosphaera sp. rholeuAM6]|nr:MAG: hypothetical protein BZ135_07070 [Methanosphaera sp. rholeuAM6]